MIGFRPDITPFAANNSDLTAELTPTTTGLTVDQCQELLQADTLYKVYSGANFHAWLKQSRDDAIRLLLTTLDARLAEAALSPRVLLPTQLIPLMRYAPPIQNLPAVRVGLRLNVLSDDVSVSIDRIGLSVNGTASVNMMLYEEELGPEFPTDMDQAVAVTGTLNGHWQTVNIPLMSSDKTYLLLYNPAELGPVQALNTFSPFPKASGCGNCKGRCWAKYLSVEPVLVDASGQVIPYGSINWGINLVVSASGDVSPRLVMDPLRMLPVLRQQIAMSFLEKIAYSKRKNPETEDARQGALFALTDKDNANRVPTLLDRAMSSLVKSMQAEASTVLDVDDSDEVTWGTL